MTTCNRCGKPTYEGSGSCQYCGAPLSGKAGSGAGAKMGTPELPEWLESLRAGERPVQAAGPQPGYPVAHIADKDALPSWMLPESAERISAEQYAAHRPTSLPVSDLPPTGIAARSLIDEQSLPTWIQENEPGQHQPAQRNISAASLLQPEALPQWMKNAEHQPPSTSAPAAQMPASPVQPPMPAQGIVANTLIDPQAIPAWMSGQNGGSSAAGVQSNVSGASLLDMNALPGWLQEDGREQKPARTERPQAPQLPAADATIGGPSFVEGNALPPWLREGIDPKQGPGYQPPAPAAGPAPAARTFNPPPRVESVKVPSRPRGEMSSYEQSEVAANFFASMLGGPSPAPNFPAQAPANRPNSSLPPQRPPQQPQPSPQGMWQDNNLAAGPQMGVGGSQQGPGAAYPPPAPYSNGYHTTGPDAFQQPPAYPTAMSRSGPLDPHGKPAKRSFLDTIRSWFTR